MTFVLKRVVSGIVLLDLVNGVVCSTECARGVLSCNVIVVTGDVKDLVKSCGMGVLLNADVSLLCMLLLLISAILLLSVLLITEVCVVASVVVKFWCELDDSLSCVTSKLKC